MTLEIESVQATEILDSRGRPTLSVQLTGVGGPMVHAGVPSGASTGSGEAVELRDGDDSLYGGSGTTTAVANVNGPIAAALTGRIFDDQIDLDEALDGTPNCDGAGAPVTPPAAGWPMQPSSR